jgi:hypothetical protein
VKTTLLCSKSYQTFQDDRTEDKEQLYFWKKVQIRNKNPGSGTAFEFRPNLLEVQTCLEKSDKFTKIHICPDLPDFEFRLAWLYREILCFHTSSPLTWFERK